MVVSESLSKWGMRFYPPLFFQRIWVVKIDRGFKGVRVKINKSVFNRNYNNSIFGGTIFSAADPFYPLLFHQLFSHKGYNVIAWSKSSEIQFIKPALAKLYFNISLSDEEIAEAEHVLNTGGKYTKSHPIDIYNTDGEICVTLMNEVYLRNLNFKENL
ncbi:PaaI family thioesterase [Mucilaginibacter sp.]|uniref:PaaI family thioesterase n=1 Tax=Mucilaginibacter sp. TaxID=1882438 RepID=UPI00260B119F|nr:DUF4442 domain-containing protein [Mucilaginibacter sp.]MDB4924932.1 hypothetical protein [Mucilaginibacter sp.]